MNNQLFRVSASEADDVWAVGFSRDSVTNADQTLVEHWNGVAWSLVASPSPGDVENYLYGVAAVSSTDAWADVYFYNQVNRRYEGLVEHWGGTAWNVISARNLGSQWNQLTSISARSSSEVWAIGSYRSASGVTKTLIERWDGTQWSVTTSPNNGSPNNASLDNYPYDVSVVPGGSNNVWTVGYYSYTDPNGQPPQTLAERWDGSAWSLVQIPSPSSLYNHLYAVAATSSNDMWAVGDFTDPSSSAVRTLVEHWNGSTWNLVLSPNPSSSDNHLTGVTAISPTDAWAVGYYDNGTGFTLHWDGTQWSVIPSPNVGTSTNMLRAVSARTSNDVWAVGDYYYNSLWLTLVAHWDGVQWTIVPSPNVSGQHNQLQAVMTLSANNAWAVGYIRGGGLIRTLVEHWDGTVTFSQAPT